MKELLIDDKRTIEGARIARTFDEGIRALMEGGWDVLHLDHDLADFVGSELVTRESLCPFAGAESDPGKKDEWNGYHIMCWLELNTQYLPKRIEVVSSNPTGIANINQVIRKLY